ncbi:hypothetical protein DM01DRAFT_1340153 [Hesseltinella vesiculosa]|uniref:Spindle pole body component n=1 Tax=Hesseltinella vesiculosa TaxID=101127 RepID=A0A1X2G4T9_9FUNG|nr:hypothetical protein DM01DRAFT_1340153 [Hesseltinella vesiculosa]
MLHELLFVLSGYTGDVFVRVPSDPSLPSKTFAIDKDFPLLHPTEREALNRLAHLGWMYHQLTTFIEDHPPHSSRYNVYMLAYCSGLATVLDDYQQLLADIETRLITKQDHTGPPDKPAVSLALLTSMLGRWELILPTLLRLTEKVKQQRDCQEHILDVLMDQVRTGIPEVYDATMFLLQQLHHIFFRQITAWVVYGQLPSQSDHRFFIIQQVPPDLDHEQPMQQTSWDGKYKLLEDRLPRYFPADLADSIFYIGKVVATTSKKTELPASMKNDHVRQLAAMIHTPQSASTLPWEQQRLQLEKIIRSIRQSVTNWLSSHVFQQKQYQLQSYFVSFRNLFLLGDADLAVSWLDGLAHTEADLHASYTSSFSSDDPNIKKRSRNQATSSPRDSLAFNQTFWPQAAREWANLLAKAAAGIKDTNSDDTHLDSLLLSGDGYTFDMTPGFSPFLDLLHTSVPGHLVYNLTWPMDLFLSSGDIRQYSYLWTFLIALKKVQQALAHAFADQDRPRLRSPVSSKPSTPVSVADPSPFDGQAERLIWRLRYWMLFWIDTLWSHIQGDVVAGHYDTLLQTCQESTFDFDNIRQAHTNYLLQLTQGCLLSSADASTALLELLKTCVSFQQWLQTHGKQHLHPQKRKKRSHSSTNQTEASHMFQALTSQYVALPPWLDHLQEMEASFIAQSRQLFDLLLQQPQYIKNSGYLDRLLMRLDYNKWYSETSYTNKLSI